MQQPRLSGRSHALVLSASALLLLTAACSKKAIVAQTPAPTSAAAPQTASNDTPAPARNLNTRTAPPVATAPANNGTMTPQERTTLNQNLARLEDALFDYDKATIRPDAMKALQENVAVIKTTLAKYPNEMVKIEAHCDERGSAEYNVALGDRRAAAAKEFLTSMGINGAQLTTVSFGKESQVCTEKTEACYQANRRAHLVASN